MQSPVALSWTRPMRILGFLETAARDAVGNVPSVSSKNVGSGSFDCILAPRGAIRKIRPIRTIRDQNVGAVPMTTREQEQGFRSLRCAQSNG